MTIKLDDNAFCLSCNLNRFHYLQDCFDKVGLKPPTLFPGAILKNGAVGCLLGHISLVMMARCLNLPYIVVYEDDAFPRPDVIKKFEIALEELQLENPYWGMLSLGRTGETSWWKGDTEDFWKNLNNRRNFKHKDSNVINVSDNIITIPKNPSGSHAYIVRNYCYNEWLWSLTNNSYSDIAMGQCNFKKNKVYWTKELLFCQKQIDKKCMTQLHNMHDVSYMYPVDYNSGLYTGYYKLTDIPPEGFTNEL